MAWDDAPPPKSDSWDKEPPKPEELGQMTQGQAAQTGAEEGLSFGLRPFLSGVAGAASSGLAGYRGMREAGRGIIPSVQRGMEEAPKGFSEERSNANQEQEQAAEQYPKTYYGSQLGAGLATAPLTPIKSLGGALKVGAGLGAATALSKAESPMGAAGYVAGGAVGGGLVHGAANKITGAIQALPEASQSVKDLANRIAAKALGPYQRDVLRMKAQGTLESVGETAMKEGIVGGARKSYEELANSAEDALNSKGNEFETMLNKISDASEKMGQTSSNAPVIPGQAGQTSGLDKNAIVNQLKKELAGDPEIPSLKNTKAQFDELINQVHETQPNMIGIKNAQNLKSRIGAELEKKNVWKRLQMGAQLNPEEEFKVAYYHALNKGVEDAADAVSEQLGPDSLKNWQKVKQEYGAIKTAAMLANNRAGREFANRFISPSDYFASFAGMNMAHNESPSIKGPIGIAFGVLNNYSRKYGNQMIAPALSSASRGLGNIQPALNLARPVGQAAQAVSPYVQPAAQRMVQPMIGGVRKNLGY